MIGNLIDYPPRGVPRALPGVARDARDDDGGRLRYEAPQLAELTRRAVSAICGAAECAQLSREAAGDS